jgi:anthranilate phosphoribosyltransferase
VLEHFGYQFTADNAILKQQLESAGICFLHAPLFHPAMRHVAPVRKELAVKTFFNMLGPLVNPGFPKKQCTGVYSLELARLYQYLLQSSEKKYMIVHALDGYDEITLTGNTKVIGNSGERILSPDDMGLSKVSAGELTGGRSVTEAAGIFEAILHGKGSKAQNDVVCANAALAIQCAKPETSLTDAIAIAYDSLLSGRALLSFTKLLAV